MSTHFQVQAFRQQFPHLTQFLPARLDEVRVSRVSAELLDRVPRSWQVAHRDGDHEEVYVYLLDKEGRSIGRREDGAYRLLPSETAPWTAVRDDHARGLDLRRSGESVGEAVARHGAEETVSEVLWISTEESETTDYREVTRATLYRAPRGFSVVSWVAEQRRRAALAIRAEVEAIDADATK